MNQKQKKKIKEGLKMKKCKYCKSKENLTIDHKHPISRGGNNEIKNLQCLCYRCNSIKGSFSDREIRRIVKWWLNINGFEHAHGRKLKDATKKSIQQ